MLYNLEEFLHLKYNHDQMDKLYKKFVLKENKIQKDNQLEKHFQLDNIFQQDTKYSINNNFIDLKPKNI